VALRLARGGQVIERNHRRFAKDAFRAEWVFLGHIKD
jgi:hypothetical protein